MASTTGVRLHCGRWCSRKSSPSAEPTQWRPLSWAILPEASNLASTSSDGRLPLAKSCMPVSTSLSCSLKLRPFGLPFCSAWLCSSANCFTASAIPVMDSVAGWNVAVGAGRAAWAHFACTRRANAIWAGTTFHVFHFSSGSDA
eukprot:9485746-Pyramimonas_sp.AAC.1